MKRAERLANNGFYGFFSVIAHIIIVWITGFLMYAPFWDSSYVPMLMSYFLNSTMMMVGFHALTSAHRRIYFIALHILFSFLSMIQIGFFFNEYTYQNYLGTEPDGEVARFDGQCGYSMLAGSNTTLIIETQLAEGVDEINSNWWTGIILIAAIYFGLSFVHLLVGIAAVCAPDPGVRTVIFCLRKKANGKRACVEGAELSRVVLSATCVMGMFLSFTQICLSYYFLGISMPLLNPIYNQNSILIFLSCACLFLPAPNPKVPAPGGNLFPNPTELGLLRNYFFPIPEKIVIGFYAFSWFAGAGLSISGFVSQSNWLAAQTVEIPNVLWRQRVQEFLEENGTFIFDGFTNTDALTYLPIWSSTVPSTTFSLWSAVDAYFTFVYFSLGIINGILTSYYLSLTFKLTNAPTADYMEVAEGG